jgi:hypothetical protein
MAEYQLFKASESPSSGAGVKDAAERLLITVTGSETSSSSSSAGILDIAEYQLSKVSEGAGVVDATFAQDSVSGMLLASCHVIHERGARG